MKTIRNTCLFILLSIPALLSAQYLANPSFEGAAGLDTLPSTWERFDPLATPDTEPLECDNFPASDGDTYITLVTHGTGSPQSGINENCIAEMAQILEEGLCYSLSVDLASRNDLGHYKWGIGFIYYREEVKLRVYGSNSSSEKGELLAETEIINHSSWRNYNFTIKPDTDINFLIIEAISPESPSGNGNLVLDNLEFTELLETRIMLNDTLETTDLPYLLTASESPSYSWTPSTGLSCYDCRSPEVNINASRTYTCRIEDASTGCPLDELYILTFIDVEEPPPVLPDDFKIPNVFTPNGDLVNDVLEIRGLPPYSTLIIFDRSGRELFSSENYDNSWNGIDMEGNPLPEGNYWYVLTTPGLKNRHKGYVYLKRD